jgi:hypothetical protein
MTFTTPTLLLDWDRLKELLPAEQSASLLKDRVFAEACVGAAQEALAAFLGYDPFLHPVVQYAGPYAAHYDADARTYGVYTTDRPVAFVRTAGVTGAAGRLSYTTAPTGGRFDYFAGWVRRDMDLDDVNAALALTGDDVVTAAEFAAAPVCPLAVEVALAQGAAVQASVSTSGALGQSSRTQDWGQNQTTTSAPRFDHLEAVFRPLARHRVPRL